MYYLYGGITCVLLKEKRNVLGKVLGNPNYMVRFRGHSSALIYSIPSFLKLSSDAADTRLTTLNLCHLPKKSFSTCPSISSLWRTMLQLPLRKLRSVVFRRMGQWPRTGSVE